MLTFLCYSRCSTCQKARKWLDQHGIAYQERPIREEHPDAQELASWQQLSGLPLRKLFNTSGQLYREMNLKDRLPAMTDEEMLQLLASDGMLVKRPLLIGEDFVLAGFRESEWAERLLPRP